MNKLNPNEQTIADKLYRPIIIGLIFSQLMWLFLPWMRFYGNALEIAVVWDGANSALGVGASALFGIAVFLLYTIVYCGLYFYSRLARKVFIYVLLLGVLDTLIYGLHVTSPVESAFGYLVSVADGFVLALVYFSSVANKFQSELHSETNP